MAKSPIKQKQTNVPKEAPTGSVAPTSLPMPPVSAPWYLNFKFQAVVLALLAVLFYGNTYKNEYALDDVVVIAQNEYVLQGISGIPDIMTKDAYYSYYKRLNGTNPVVGGRYRPLSIVLFAIEQQLMGAIPAEKMDSTLKEVMVNGIKGPYRERFLQQMHVRHLLNVLWFALSVVVLLYVLREIIFKQQHLTAFIAALIFTIHPLHTEVVANVKSSDEILSLLFISLTFLFAFRYHETRKKSYLLAGIACYALAFLAKEYAISLIALLPLGFYLFRKTTVAQSMRASLPYYAVAVCYILLRLQVMEPVTETSGTNLQTNPYALATPDERIATEISTCLRYLKLLVYPHPLSSDYSYNSIPYVGFGHPMVWLSLVVHLGIAYGIYYFGRKRHLLAFPLAFYLLHLLLICNLFFDIGAPMGERLVYHSSLGFAIGSGYLLCWLSGLIKPPKLQMPALAACMLVLTIAAGAKTITRNTQWKNDETLFTADIITCPNSILINFNTAYVYINKTDTVTDEARKKAYLRTAIDLLTRVVTIDGTNYSAYRNRSIAYLKIGQTDSAYADVDRVRALFPHPQLPEMYFNVANFYIFHQEYQKAIAPLQQALQLNPNYAEARNALQLLGTIK